MGMVEILRTKGDSKDLAKDPQSEFFPIHLFADISIACMVYR